MCKTLLKLLKAFVCYCGHTLKQPFFLTLNKRINPLASLAHQIHDYNRCLFLTSCVLKLSSVCRQATVCVLFHTTAIHPGFQTTVHIGNVRQTAVIEGIMAIGGIHTNEKASVLFRFLRHPEFVTVGMRLLFREGSTKGIGKITQVFPLRSVAG